MKTIKYLGGIHSLADGEEDIYLGHDTGTWKPVNLAAGEEADVTDEKAAQLAEDFPGCFAVDGKTSGTRRKKPALLEVVDDTPEPTIDEVLADQEKEEAPEPDGETETTPEAEAEMTPTPEPDEDLAGQLMAHSRSHLNAAAKKLKIKDADKLQNKAAVVEAIIAAKNGDGE